MPTTFTMPKLSPTMEEGTIVKWCKKEGEFIEAGEVVIEVATDKATVEHAALDEGWLRKIIVEEGDVAIVNQAVAILTEDEKESIDGYKPEGITISEPEVAAIEEVADAPAKKSAAAAPALSQPGFAPEQPLEDYQWGEASDEVVASPLAKRIAAEKGLDLTTVKGSGPRGRIIEEDLATAQHAGLVTFGSNQRPTEKPGSYEEEALSPIRKVIGDRLQQSKSFIPHFYVTQDIDASAMMELREQLKKYNLKISVNDLVMRATALALRAEPSVNAGFNSVSGKIIRFKTIDLSVAVSLPDGLITPVIRHADYKNIGELSAEVKALAKKARDGKLMPEEYKGGSFTISNLGMYGVSDFKAVINPPQAAILAIGGILDQPVVRDHHVVPGKVMKVTLAADHRVCDGADVAKFLIVLKSYLENPAGLLV